MAEDTNNQSQADAYQANAELNRAHQHYTQDRSDVHNAKAASDPHRDNSGDALGELYRRYDTLQRRHNELQALYYQVEDELHVAQVERYNIFVLSAIWGIASSAALCLLIFIIYEIARRY